MENKLQKQTTEIGQSWKNSVADLKQGIARPKTAELALNNNSPSLVLIKKEFGEEELLIYVSELLTDCVLSFNIGKTMNAEQIKLTAEYIAEDYYFLKPEELKYCFAQAQKGVYGKIYDRIDTSIIFEWFDKYIEERMGSVEKNNQNKTNEFKSQDYKNASSQTILPALKEVVENKKKVHQNEEKTPKKAELDLSNKIMKEFDELFDEQNEFDKGGFRMVKYKGKDYSGSEYLDIRLGEI